ncbi:hypothetical protein P7T05_08205 [Pantoea anthophila]|uniref:hypothetical protein n=1 Tax=Pantoea anthophila TaxID=470931 RepID=UPI00254C506E|nr:hypothetical protein [Pantoea anthophila]WIM56515.1 hypothetical protein P7T05_08205 [Pantoea anthophila]
MSKDRYEATNTFVYQVSRPNGEPLAEHFRFVEQPLEPLEEGAAWVKNVHFSVDPYMRECMDGDWELNTPLEGRTIGQVVQSATPRLVPGDWVFHREGWRTYAQVKPDEVRVIQPIEGVPLRAWLSVLGGTGLTAWVALTRIVQLQAGESIFALHEALRLLNAETLSVRIIRHRNSSRGLQHALLQLGLALAAPEVTRLNAVVGFFLPAGIASPDLIEHLLVEHKIEISASFGSPLLRIGQIGEQCRAENVFRLVNALALTLETLGQPVDRVAALESLTLLSEGAMPL